MIIRVISIIIGSAVALGSIYLQFQKTITLTELLVIVVLVVALHTFVEVRHHHQHTTRIDHLRRTKILDRVSSPFIEKFRQHDPQLKLYVLVLTFRCRWPPLPCYVFKRKWAASGGAPVLGIEATIKQGLPGLVVQQRVPLGHCPRDLKGGELNLSLKQLERLRKVEYELAVPLFEKFADTGNETGQVVGVLILCCQKKGFLRSLNPGRPAEENEKRLAEEMTKLSRAWVAPLFSWRVDR